MHCVDIPGNLATLHPQGLSKDQRFRKGTKNSFSEVQKKDFKLR